MVKPWGKPAATCPSCDQTLGDEHPYQWCDGCGKPLPKEVLMQIPRQVELATRNAEVSSREEQSSAPSTSTNLSNQPLNHSHLNNLRASTCYPAFRGFIAFFTSIGYVAAAIICVAGFFGGSFAALVISVVAGVVTALLVKVAAEASLMIADIADSAIDASSRNSGAA